MENFTLQHFVLLENAFQLFYMTNEAAICCCFFLSIFQMHIEFKPESNNGIILLTGERDDLSGDFLAVLIDQGHIEFWWVINTLIHLQYAQENEWTDNYYNVVIESQFEKNSTEKNMNRVEFVEWAFERMIETKKNQTWITNSIRNSIGKTIQLD